MKAIRVDVLGGGIAGLTSSIALRLLGARVTMRARESLLADGLSVSNHVASSFPSASVLAHSVALPLEMEPCLPDLEKLFEAFNPASAAAEVTRRQNHYELFSDCPGEPPRDLYRDVVPVNDLEDLERDLLTGTFAPNQTLRGWRLRVLFVEYPRYIERLARLARSLGIRVARGDVNAETVRRSGADAFVNCLGSGGHQLLGDDPLDNGRIAGILVHDRGHTLHHCRGPLGVFSYNAHIARGPCTHTNLDGSPTDLYCYPRQDGLVLGGTRQALPEGDDAFAARPVTLPHTFLSGHLRVLRRLYTINLERRHLQARQGFRPVRFRHDGQIAEPRIEAIDLAGRPLVHCYGFGGAGLTLSWAAASRVCQLVEQAPGTDDGKPTDLADRLRQIRQRVKRTLRH